MGPVFSTTKAKAFLDKVLDDQDLPSFIPVGNCSKGNYYVMPKTKNNKY